MVLAGTIVLTGVIVAPVPQFEVAPVSAKFVSVPFLALLVLSVKEVKPVLKEANTVLIALIDRVRMLDNDLIRLNQKVDVVLHLRGKTIDHERMRAEEKINQIKKDDE